MSEAEAFLRDTGLTCNYDERVVEYHDSIVFVMVIRPYLVEGRLTFFDETQEEGGEGDYIYQPVLFLSHNWDDLQEQLVQYERRTPATEDQYAICACRICRSGIRQGEITGIVVQGEIQRSIRDPDGRGYSNRFERQDPDPTLICVVCLANFNEEIQTLWEDGVSENEECDEGRIARCWRQGCAGNCPNKAR